jgi:hypothetical protein
LKLIGSVGMLAVGADAKAKAKRQCALDGEQEPLAKKPKNGSVPKHILK